MLVIDVAGRSGDVGDRVRRDRLAAGLTQEELSERSGLSVRAICDIECGRTRRPRHSTLRQIAVAMRLPVRARDAMAGTQTWQPVMQLPADLADFTGRREQVSRLVAMTSGDNGAGADGHDQGRADRDDQRSRAGAVVIWAVAGAGGIGKTALAVHAAHQLAPRFPDGQLFLNLRGSSTRPVTTADALARFLRDLGADPAALPADEAERAARFRSLLAGRRLLIMLDDARDAAQVRSLLPGSAGCAVVVTSRSSLKDLESARLLDLDVLTSADAAALFAGIVGQARTAAEPAAASAVLVACGGLPLAIRIAAARLAARPGWSIAALAARLADARKRLDELQAGDLAVRASFLVSYANLRAADGNPSHRPDQTFRLLGLAEGPDMGLPAAAALLGVPAPRAERSLELLVDAHLLQSAAPGRYRFHDLLRVYAAEQARAEEAPAARAGAVHRMLGWYLHTATAAARLISPQRTHVTLAEAEPSAEPMAFSSYASALAWLDAEHANLVAAVSQAASHDEHEIAWKLAVSLWDLFHLRGHVGDWIATHETGLASARQLRDRNAEQWLMGHLAGGYLQADQPLAAIDWLYQVLPLHRELGQLREQAITQLNLGLALRDLGRLDEAARPLQESLDFFRAAGDRYGEGLALTTTGTLSQLRGRLSDAIGQYQLALSALREADSVVHVGEVLFALCQARLKLGQLDAAVDEATAAAELNRQTGHRQNEAGAMAVLGRALRDRGHPEQARRHWLGAMAIFTELGDPQAAEVAADLSSLDGGESCQARPQAQSRAG
jgi:transcriptional regulator with XRE-family HTH domain/tetratricopeptide (TPR) repeat protein